MSIELGISSADFIEHYQEKKPFLIKGAVKNNVFSWRDANEIFERCDVSSGDFKLSYDGVRPKSEYVESYWDIGTLRHRLIKPVVYDYLRKGATLIANKISNEPKVNLFSRQVAEFTGRQVVSSAYAAFGLRDSFRCHWDTRDVFAIQLIGRKRWIVYEPSFEMPLFTQQSRDLEDHYPCPEKPYMDFILEEGDVFYLPRGWWHNPLPLGEPTFHLALGTFPAYAMDYLSWVMKRMPELLEARCSLSYWEKDHKGLAKISRHLEMLLQEPENYRRFMDEFAGNIRVESPLAIDVLGDPEVAHIPENASLRLSANSPHGLESGYVIANGIKLNLDDQGLQLMRTIAFRPNITLADLMATHADIDSEKLRQVVTDLCRQDFIELSRF